MRRMFGKLFLELTGWKLEGELPQARRVVMIAAPHTSNWDFPFTIAAAAALDVPLAWMGKHTLFAGPKGRLFRLLGGIPIDRTKANDTVQAMIDELCARDELVLLVPAEGTRKAGAYWKSGFYHIARGAGVPIVLSYLDWRHKRAGIGPLIWPSGDVKADMERIRAFYADKHGRHPERFTAPRLREEQARLAAH